MEQLMTKSQLDKWGGVGSVGAGAMCIWFALRHDPNDYMWKVWWLMCVLLVLNGIAMLVYAMRTKGPGKPVGH